MSMAPEKPARRPDEPPAPARASDSSPDSSPDPSSDPSPETLSPRAPTAGPAGCHTTWAEDWREQWRAKETTAAGAIQQILPGNSVFVGTGCAEPRTLVDELLQQAHRFPDLELVHFLPLGGDRYFPADREIPFRHNNLFIGDAMREYVQTGTADYTPVMASQVGDLFRSGLLNVDVACVQLSPPDAFGFASLGIGVDFAPAAIKAAYVVLAEINPNVPRTHGDGFVHMKDVDYFVYSERPLLEYTFPEPEETDFRVAKHVVRLLRHKSCLHVGLGAIPRAVLQHLAEHPTKHDLGVHTFFLTPDFVPLVEQGVLTCRRKNYFPEKIVACSALGDADLYAFIHQNPYCELRTAKRVCNPGRVARNDRLVSITQARQIDLTGQVNTSTRGYAFYSGVGYAVDFARGAAYSKGGKPVVALRSRDPETGRPQIVSHLDEGAGVLLNRADVHYVVTEWGVAYLHGKTIRERALALVNIAHPDDRQALLAQLKKKHYVYEDQLLPTTPDGRVVVYPHQYETVTRLADDTRVRVRPLKPTDESLLQDLCYNLDQGDRVSRFFACVDRFDHARTQKDVVMDYESHMALGAFTGEIGQERLVGSADYFLGPDGFAEIAVVVRSAWQHKGIGTLLLHYLTIVARERNIRGFVGMVLQRNYPALGMIRKAFKGYNLEVQAPDHLAGDEEVTFVVRFQAD